MKIIIYVRAREDNLHPNRFTITAILFEALTAIMTEETRSGNRTADKIFDLQESTFWMTVDNVPYPHQLVIDLSKVETVTGFRYLPRAEKEYPGMIKEYRVYVKSADFNY